MFNNKHLLITFLLFILILVPFCAQALTVVPNDPYYAANQYYIQQTKTDQAWGYSIGSEEVIVAVIDSGVDIDHPDLKDNIWINQDEIPNNNLDDDHNGYIDDVSGWNFVENNNDPNPQYLNYTTEGASHGTLVAGIIAAVGQNQEGLVGICWQAKIMPLRALNSLGEGDIEDASSAIRYAVDNGADIINFSFVGSVYSNVFFEAIKYAYTKGAVLVAAVGNDALGSASFTGGNLDQQPVYPACFKNSFDDLVIGVGAVDKANQKSDFSNYGYNCLDINAPGVDIVSTQTINASLGSPFTASYSGFWNGTSFAAPQIAGVAALIKALNPNYNNKQIASFILDTADKIDAYNPEYQGKMGRGLLNAKRALRAASPVNFTPRDPTEIVYLQKSNTALWIKDKIDQTAFTNNFADISLSFKNTGSITWEPIYLKIKLTDWQGRPLNFSTSLFSFQETQNVLPSQIATFYYNLKTPSQSGVYQIKFQLKYKDLDVRGGALYKTITVNSARSAIITENNLPLAVKESWGTVPVIVKIKNNSDLTWKKEQTSLRLQNDDNNFYFSKNGVKINNISPQELEIAPNSTATFKFTLYFKNSPQGIKYYSFRLKTDGELLNIEGGEKLMRID